ncbi:hypothetical protein [Nocardia acididurans]|nr:hypothetical protein [Nocardia acididurans]
MIGIVVTLAALSIMTIMAISTSVAEHSPRTLVRVRATEPRRR